MSSLFRDEVIEELRNNGLGAAISRHRGFAWAVSATSLAFCITLLGVIFLAHIDRHANAQGYLVPEGGITRVHSPIAGRISDVFVREGAVVKEGEPLFQVSDERLDQGGEPTRMLQEAAIRRRIASARESIENQRALFRRNAAGIRERIVMLERELGQLDSEADVQKRRLALAELTTARFLDLEGRRFISPAARQEKEDAQLEQQARLQAIQRSRSSLSRDLSILNDELAMLPMKERAVVADLDRNIAELEQQRLEATGRSGTTIVAPIAGIAGPITVERGQSVTSDRVLITLVPPNTNFEALLFIPSKSIGFLAPGQKVALRFQAYPYQKFGHHYGRIIEISRTPLSSGEMIYPISPAEITLPLLGALPNSINAGEPMFRVRVKLDNQKVTVYGLDIDLQTGLQMEASIVVDTRTIFEWIFEPLYSVRGRLK